MVSANYLYVRNVLAINLLGHYQEPSGERRRS